MLSKLFRFLLVFLLILPFCGISVAKADDLILQDDGKVILLITNDNGVLGVETKESEKPKTPAASAPQVNSPQQNQNKPQSGTATSAPSSNATPQPPAKTVPLVPAHTESTVQINPPINNDKKINVIITTQTPSQSLQPNTNTTVKSATTIIPSKHSTTSQSPTITAQNTISGITPVSTNTNSPANAIIVTKSVDQIIAQGSNGQPVITIRSDQAHQLTIQQGTTQVTTDLQLQINTITHSLSIPSADESAKVSVLPTEAFQGIMNTGMLDTKSLNGVKMNLMQDTTGVNYNVQSEKRGKLFGVFDVQSPVQIKLSAQSGKVVKTSQSPLFSILGGFIK